MPSTIEMETERPEVTRRLLVDKITIGERFRKENDGNSEEERISSLRESIRLEGLLHPIVVEDMKDDSFLLLAGFRRFTACKQLGWIEIEASVKINLTEAQRLEIEFDENIFRKSMEWHERCALRDKIHSLKQEIYGKAEGGRPTNTPAVDGNEPDSPTPPPTPGWSLQDTASLLGTSAPRVSQDIALARIISRVPNLKDFNQNDALRCIRRTIEEIERELSIRKSSKLIENLWFGDAALVLRHVPDASVDLIIWDPPYGINVQNMNSDQENAFGHRDKSHFDDSPEQAQKTIRSVIPELARVLKPNGHMYVFFGITEYKWIYPILDEHFNGFIDPIPLIWMKGKDSWGTGDWSRKYARQYEAIFHIAKPGRSLTSVHGNVLEFVADSREFTAEKPQALLRLLIEQSTKEGELVLDPMAGHGSSLLAAARLGRKYYGIEIVESAYKVCKLRLQNLERELITAVQEEESLSPELEDEI